jgi:hypothetical protein
MAKALQDGSGEGHDSDEYEVGYRKPPRHSQFPLGKSGNPKGRRKGSRGLKTDLQQELASGHTIQINGKPIKGTKQQLMVKTLATRAASGDLKATALLVPLVLQVFGIEDRGTGKEQLSAPDQALLDFMMGFGSDDGSAGPGAAGLDPAAAGGLGEIPDPPDDRGATNSGEDHGHD